MNLTELELIYIQRKLEEAHETINEYLGTSAVISDRTRKVFNSVRDKVNSACIDIEEYLG